MEERKREKERKKESEGDEKRAVKEEKNASVQLEFVPVGRE